MKAYARKVTQFGEWCAEQGMPLSYHHHMAAVVETEPELDAFMRIPARAFRCCSMRGIWHLPAAMCCGDRQSPHAHQPCACEGCPPVGHRRAGPSKQSSSTRWRLVPSRCRAMARWISARSSSARRNMAMRAGSSSRPSRTRKKNRRQDGGDRPRGTDAGDDAPAFYTVVA